MHHVTMEKPEMQNYITERSNEAHNNESKMTILW